MEVIDKIQSVITSPDKFFESVKKEPLVPAFKYLAIITLVPTAIMLVLAYAASSIFNLIFGSMLLMGGTQGASLGGLLGGLFTTLAIVGVIIIYVMILVGSFIGAGVLHLFVYLLGGKNGYQNTYKASAYASTPSTLLGWIPLISFIASLWTLFLEVKALKSLQGLTTGRAILAIILPAVIIGAVIGSIVAAGLMSGLFTVPAV